MNREVARYGPPMTRITVGTPRRLSSGVTGGSFLERLRSDVGLPTHEDGPDRWQRRCPSNGKGAY